MSIGMPGWRLFWRFHLLQRLDC